MSKSYSSPLRKLIVLVLITGMIIFIVWGFWRASQPPPVFFQGQMDAHEVDIAPKITARISQVFVTEGQQIMPGDMLITMDSPEIRAKVAQAEAAEQAAEAEAAKAHDGTRPQDIRAAHDQWLAAQTAAELAQVSWRRIENLYTQGLVSAQQRDEASANYRASNSKASAARAQYELALAGARSEDKAAADAQARRVAGVVAEAEALAAETRLASPIGGEVQQVFAKVGELSPKGVPVVSVVDLSDQWAVINIREDYLGHFGMGSRFVGVLPALNNKKATFQVYYVSALPDFATWRATRADQGFDARTFEVRARPIHPIPGARPGMTVVVQNSD